MVEAEDKSRGGAEPGEGEPHYPTPLTVAGRVRSFRHALAGLWFVLRSQHNAWLHAVATAAALALAGVLEATVADFAPGDWCALALAITLVWVAEAFNTGLEVLSDAVEPSRHPVIKVAKDVAAGAVLMASVGAAAVGCILFAGPVAALARRVLGGE